MRRGTYGVAALLVVATMACESVNTRIEVESVPTTMPVNICRELVYAIDAEAAVKGTAVEPETGFAALKERCGADVVDTAHRSFLDKTTSCTAGGHPRVDAKLNCAD